MIRRTITIYFVLSTLTRFATSFFMATYASYLMARGLDVFQMNLVNSMFAVSTFLLEVPTGVIADIFGRKASFVASCLFWAGSMLLYSQADTFALCVVAELLGAFGATLESGAFDAWMVDQMKHHKFNGSFRKVFGWGNQLSAAVSISGTLLGAMLYDHNISYTWFAAAGAMTLTAIIGGFCMREDYRAKARMRLRDAFNRFWGTTTQGIRFVRGSSAIRFAILMATLQCIAVQTANMHWQPLLRPFVGNQTELGWIAVAIRVMLIFGAFLATRSEKLMSDRKLMVIANLIIGFGLASVIPVAGSLLAVIPFLFHELGRGIYKPVQDAHVNEQFKGTERATVLSLQAMGNHIGGAIGLLVSGYLARTYSIPATWLTMGIMLVIGTLILAWNRKRI